MGRDILDLWVYSAGRRAGGLGVVVLGGHACIQCIFGMDDIQGGKRGVYGCGGGAAGRGRDQQKAGEDGKEGRTKDAVSVMETKGMSSRMRVS